MPIKDLMRRKNAMVWAC